MSKGTVYKRRDGRWECRISMGKDENGRRVFRSFYGKSREEAEYKAMIAQGQAEESYAVTEMTVRELVTEWLHVTASRIKESTAVNYVMKAEKHLKAMKTGTSEQKLNALIGLESVKESIRKLKAFALVNKDNTDFNLHMTFCGNPGTGKTEVARIIAGILHENGLLPTDKVVETDRSGLVAAYVGQTALKTMERIEEAMGGVLFIDEAYALTQSEHKGDYNRSISILKSIVALILMVVFYFIDQSSHKKEDEKT